MAHHLEENLSQDSMNVFFLAELLSSHLWDCSKKKNAVAAKKRGVCKTGDGKRQTTNKVKYDSVIDAKRFLFRKDMQEVPLLYLVCCSSYTSMQGSKNYKTTKLWHDFGLVVDIDIWRNRINPFH